MRFEWFVAQRYLRSPYRTAVLRLVLAGILLLALARQNKVEDIEKIMLDLLSREPRPKWEGNAADALPEAARKLAHARKNRTAVLVLEQAVRSGSYSLDGVRSDPAFAPVRESEEFRELVKKLSK